MQDTENRQPASTSALTEAGDALLIDDRRSWTAERAIHTANRLAHLIRAEVTGGRRVAIYAENAGEAVLAHLGALRSGVSAVPVNAHLAADELAYVLEVAEATLVIAGPVTAERAKAAAEQVTGVRVVTWGTPEWDSWLSSAPADAPDDDRPIRPSLLFTSGTTGRPKAVELPPNVFPRRDSWTDFIEASKTNRFVGLGRHLVVAPLHHTGPLNAVRALAVGTPVGILGRFDPARTLEAIHRWEIGSTTLVPTHLSRLSALPSSERTRFTTASLKLVFQTGASCPVPVKREMIEWWGPVFLEAYGATEVGVTCAITSADWLEHPGSVGRAKPPYEVVVVDETGTAVPVGQEGRLCFRDSTGRGIVYHGDPDRSAAAHIEPGVFTLGEIGRVDADGWVYVTDRFADMVVTGGVNVYPAEMEQVLVQHPEVTDVAGIGLPDDDLGEILVALVVPRTTEAGPTPAELHAFCEQHLSRYKCPREIRVVPTLDRNALGKLDKHALKRAHG